MAKLSLEQMLNIAGAKKSELIGLSELLELKPKRINDFLTAKNQAADVAPQYQVAFWTAWKEFSGDVEKVAAACIKTVMATSTKIDDRPISGGQFDAITSNVRKLNGTRFLFTSAQNNTDVHTDFLKTLKVYKKHNDAQLIVGQFVYNKNGFQNGVQDDEEIYFDASLKDYFMTEGAEICPGVQWCGELNILPSTKYPLTGLEQHGGKLAAIVPHAKIALESVATAKSKAAKLLYATGAVTLRNYIQKKAGQLAEKEHCYGALIVEVDSKGNWFARQIQTDESGAFYDLDKFYMPDGTILENQRPIAANWGDLHSEKADLQQTEICMKMLDELEPENQFFHDSFDMQNRNHHNRNSGAFLMDQSRMGATVKKDLEQCASILNMYERPFINSFIIESNHDLALSGWLDCPMYRFSTDSVNSLTYLELQLKTYQAIVENDTNFNLLEYSLKEWVDMPVPEYWRFLNVDESLEIAGVEMGMHGHVGANGSRGSPKQFRKLDCKANTGHTHTCSIHGNVFTSGVTGNMEMGYNIGFSSWSHSHILTYPNGFRTIVTTMSNEYRATS